METRGRKQKDRPLVNLALVNPCQLFSRPAFYFLFFCGVRLLPSVDEIGAYSSACDIGHGMYHGYYEVQADDDGDAGSRDADLREQHRQDQKGASGYCRGCH